MATIAIVGYEQDCNCEHCGRPLVHGVRISDGRVVGATCLDKKLTAPRVDSRTKKQYRFGSEFIIRCAKVAQFHAPISWARFGVSQSSMIFEAA